MDTILVSGLTNVVVATALAIGVCIATRVWSNPYVARRLWLAVLLKFVMPPIFAISLPFGFPSPTAADRADEFQGAASSRVDHAEPTTGLTRVGSRERSPVVEIASLEAHSVGVPVTTVTLPTAIVSMQAVKWITGAIWLVGALVMAIVALSRISRFHALIQRAKLASEELQQRMVALATQIGLTRLPLLRLTDGKVPPLVWCIGKRPTILLPTALLTRLRDTTITTVLAHELTHVRRRDGWVRWLELLVVSLYWWCPVVWMARRKLQEAEEQCCDADVLRLFPALQKCYATAVLETLELLTDGRPLKFGGTGLGSRSSLKRRFEMIVNQGPAVPPTRIARGLLLASAAAVLLLAPAAASSGDPSERATRSAALESPCTVTLPDGTKVDGQLVEVGNNRIVILSSKLPPEEPAPSTSNGAEPEDFPPDDDALPWKVELVECIRIAIGHHRDARLLQTNSLDGTLVVAISAGSNIDPLDFRESLVRLVNDMEIAYWDLYRHTSDLALLGSGRDTSLDLWKAAKHADPDDDTATANEASCRAQYFNLRRQSAQALSEFHSAEARLRHVLGLAARDGRIIIPTTKPREAASDFDWDRVQLEAFASRVEIAKQKRAIENRENQLRSSSGRGAQHRHNALMLARDQAILKDLELEISHQLGDAVRQVDLTHQLLETNRNRAAAARKEFEATDEARKASRVSLDLLLDVHSRQIDAERAYNDAQVEYERAMACVDRHTSSLLSKYGISIAESQ